MLMMVSTHLYIYFIVITLALLQKHYLKINNQHFFNPSNFALIMALIFFYDEAHLVLGQLWDELWLAIVLLSMAVFILVRVNRWIISFCFVLFYLLFQYLFIVSSDPVLVMEEIYHRFYSISFVLFILFMLTDPRTTPSKNYWQIVFAFCLAMFSVILDYVYGFRVQHLFLSLFLFSLFTPLLELWHTAEKKSLVVMTFSLFLLATVAIIFIENQTPYYFTMEN
jgi:Na+-translocating ferredoxin:NAD+ oxidoreductase RnfD subunit